VGQSLILSSLFYDATSLDSHSFTHGISLNMTFLSPELWFVYSLVGAADHEILVGRLDSVFNPTVVVGRKEPTFITVLTRWKRGPLSYLSIG
jgi:hypothetical protein